MAAGFPDEAAAVLRQRLQSRSRDSRVLLALARLEFEAGDRAEAKELCARVSVHHPDRAAASALRKTIETVEWGEARRAQERAALKASAKLRAQARDLAKARDFNAALLLVREALHRDPGNAKAERDLARLLDRTGDPAAALRHWQAVHRRSPGDLDAVRRLTGFAEIDRTFPVPEDWRSFAAEASAGDILAAVKELFFLGDEGNQFRLADACAEAAAARGEIGGVARYVEARLHLAQGAFSKALEIAQAALAGSPAAEGALEGLSSELLRVVTVSLTRLGRHEEALAALAAAALPPEETARLEVNIVWRQDPRRAADRVREVSGSETPVATALACQVQALAGDRAGARETLAAAWLRADGSPSAELLLSGASLAHSEGDALRFRRLLRRYFERFGLELPLKPSPEPFDFAELSFTLDEQVAEGPLVSVIMTAFNAEATLAQAAGSVLKQTYRNLELIIVDDASSDGTGGVLAGIAASDPRVTVLRQAVNAGTYAGRNAALGIARGAYLTFHDSDDWCHPRRLERHVACMEAFPDLAASRSKWIRLTQSGEIVLRWTGAFTQNNPSSVFCRRAVFDDLGCFDPVRVSADAEHLSRVLIRYGPECVARLPLPLVIGLSHAGSLTRSGVGAQDAEGYSAVRERYRTDALAWHRAAMRDGDLHVSADPAKRRFATHPDLLAPGKTDA